MLAKTKSKFINDIWVTGYYEGLKVIGRTFRFRDQEMVSIVSEIATISDVPFSALESAKALSITGSSNNEKLVKRPIMSKNLVKSFMDGQTAANLN